ncbi:MAG: hypothetical protein NTX22_00430 [Ignavibacteriales bacterium]|nr:hypothetical protein [Ignavibacteriales bacterium]
MKSLLSVFLVLVLTVSLFAEQFNKGEKVAQLGIGFGHAGIYGDMGFPPLIAGFQYGILKNISVGGIIGYSSSSDKWGDDSYGWEYTYTYIFIGARGEYHFLENVEKLDLYAGVTLGYDIVTASSKVHGNNNYGYNGSSASASYALTGIHGGVRYYVSPQFAVWGEVGYGVSLISGGVAFKF